MGSTWRAVDIRRVRCNPQIRELAGQVLGAISVYAPEPEVSGFSQSAQWLPSALPDALANAIRDRNIHIEGL